MLTYGDGLIKYSISEFKQERSIISQCEGKPSPSLRLSSKYFVSLHLTYAIKKYTLTLNLTPLSESLGNLQTSISH